MQREFVSLIHKTTKRDYLARVTERDKAEAATLACEWGVDYWDGSRQTGYGGYHYDGRWRKVADAMVNTYNLKSGMKVLDVGCGKGFLMHDLKEACPGLEVYGIDISSYAITFAMNDVKNCIRKESAASLGFEDNTFDLVISITTLHNLFIHDLFSALKEIERIGKLDKYVCVEAYRNEREKVNLMYWQLTCRAFHTPDEWKWIFQQTRYTGDHEFIYFE